MRRAAHRTASARPPLPVPRLQDIVAGVLQVHPAEQEHIWFVVDDEDHGPSSSVTAPSPGACWKCLLLLVVDR